MLSKTIESSMQLQSIKNASDFVIVTLALAATPGLIFGALS